MPVKVIKYTCEFKCGTKAKGTLPMIRSHEAVCFKNPERKTCSTCEHEIYYKDGEDHHEIHGIVTESWMVRGCKKLTDEQYSHLQETQEWHSEKPVFHILPVVLCPHWEKKQ